MRRHFGNDERDLLDVSWDVDYVGVSNGEESKEADLGVFWHRFGVAAVQRRSLRVQAVRWLYADQQKQVEHELHRDNRRDWFLFVWTDLLAGGCVEDLVRLSLSSVGDEFTADLRGSRVCRRVHSVFVVERMESEVVDISSRTRRTGRR